MVGVDPLFTPTFLWNFGDPGSGVDNTSTLRNPTHTYSDGDDHEVTLIVNGATDSDTVIATVSIEPDAPTADFTPDTGDGNVGLGQTAQSVDFDSSASSGIIDTYAWVFENGTPSTSSVPNPTGISFPEGSHDVTLTVTGPGGSSTPEVQQIDITRTFEFTPSQDATLHESATGAINGGADGRLFVGQTAQSAGLNERRFLIQFDLSLLGNSPTVSEATLTLTQNTTSGNDTGPLTLARVDNDKPWVEGSKEGDGAGEASGNGEVTWIHAEKGTLDWDSAGGDFFGTGTAASVSSGELVFSSATMRSDVASWGNPANPNNGWLVRDTTPSGSGGPPGSSNPGTSAVYGFASSENLTSADRPTLLVTWLP